MQRSMTKRIVINTFWLSVLLHLLFLAGFTLVIVWQPQVQQEKAPNVYVPSYVYTGKTATVQQHRAVRSETKQRVENKTQQQAQKAEKSLLPEAKKGIPKKTIFASTMDMLQQNQLRAISQSLKSSEPIYLIGEENGVSDPFILLIGKALSAHFEYPRTAGELGIRGRVLVRMTIHPGGYFSDVQIVKSSNTQDFDNAALYAVNQAPVIQGLDHFLSEPKSIVVGFIFR